MSEVATGTIVTWRTYDLIWVLPEADLETGVEMNSFVWENIQRKWWGHGEVSQGREES